MSGSQAARLAACAALTQLLRAKCGKDVSVGRIDWMSTKNALQLTLHLYPPAAQAVQITTVVKLSRTYPDDKSYCDQDVLDDAAANFDCKELTPPASD